MIRCIAIDDEPLALSIVESFARNVPFLSLEKTFSNGIEAMNYINNNSVDLMFVDINMPHITGIELARILESPPMIIFTTAYQNHALDGFELNAIDYLVKPFSFERFLKASAKADEMFSLRAKAEGVALLSPQESRYIMVKVDSSVVKIELSDIVMIEGLKDYIKIHCSAKSYVTKSTMKNIEERLPTSQFMRIHKSFIINIEHVLSFENNHVILSVGRVPLGLGYKEVFTSFIEHNKL